MSKACRSDSLDWVSKDAAQIMWSWCHLEVKFFKEVLGCPLAASIWNSCLLRAASGHSVSLILPLHPFPVLLSSAVHLSLPLPSFGKSVETTFHYLALQTSSSVPTLDSFCPGRRNGLSNFFHFPRVIFPVRYPARSVHTWKGRLDAVKEGFSLPRAVVAVTLAGGLSPVLALGFLLVNKKIPPSFSEHAHISQNSSLGSNCSKWAFVYFLSTS